MMTPAEKRRLSRLSTLLGKRNATIVALRDERHELLCRLHSLQEDLAQRERTIELLKQSGPPLPQKSVDAIANRMVRAIQSAVPPPK
jgi:hypothetical protein